MRDALIPGDWNLVVVRRREAPKAPATLQAAPTPARHRPPTCTEMREFFRTAAQPVRARRAASR